MSPVKFWACVWDSIQSEAIMLLAPQHFSLSFLLFKRYWLNYWHTSLSSRQTMFQIFRNNATKTGMNSTANKHYQLSNKIPLSSLSLTFVHYEN